MTLLSLIYLPYALFKLVLDADRKIFSSNVISAYHFLQHNRRVRYAVDNASYKIRQRLLNVFENPILA